MARDNHASYTRIGLTVVIGVIAIVATLIYLGGMRGRGSEILVETYYDKPVAGLSVGSVVNFRGVKIGEVREISFVGNKYVVEGQDGSRIYILIALDGRTLAAADVDEVEFAARIQQDVNSRGLRVSVVSSGITGLSRMECDFYNPENLDPVPPLTWTPRHVYVPAKISLFDNLAVAATKVLNQVNRMDLNAAWSNINASVEALARATDSASTMIQTRQGDVDRILDDISETTVSLKGLSAELKRNPSLLIRERTPSRLEETE